MSEIVPTEELDCRGMNCPIPVLKTKKVIVRLSSGDVLRVVATDPGTVADFLAFSKRTGHEILEHSEGDGEFVFIFKKK